MGDKINLKLDKRELQGKKVKLLRKDGLVPAVVYGPGVEPINVQAAHNVLEKVVRDAGKHSPVHLTIDGKKKIAMIKDVDSDPVKSQIRHVSFHAVKQNEPVTAEVPIRLTGEGESEAEKAGLIVLQSLDKIEIRALPLDLPEALEVSIVELKAAGDHVTVGDIDLPANIELVERVLGPEENEEDAPRVTDLVVATTYEPSALQAANDAAGGDAEDESEVESENGSDEDPAAGPAEEDMPGGKGQDEPKQSNVDANS
jgi:large subunit ribosomal protein L25